MSPKSTIYTPKRDDEHPRHFHMGFPPPPPEAVTYSIDGSSTAGNETAALVLGAVSI